MDQQISDWSRRVVRHDTQYCEQNAPHQQQWTRLMMHADEIWPVLRRRRWVFQDLMVRTQLGGYSVEVLAMPHT